MYLPENDKNIVGKAKQDKEVMASGDWQAAKERADFQAAVRVVDQAWNLKKTDQLRRVLDDPKNIILVTQPSTSKQNMIPVALAKRLSVELKTIYIDGDDYFNTRHRQQSKHIPQYRRAFEKRIFVSNNIEELKEKIGSKNVVIIEDVLTTGGSVADFAHHLHNEGIKTESITGLMGEKRLKIDEKTFEKLDQALKGNTIAVNSSELAQHITRAEAGGLIMMINSARSENARKKLTGNLQGLLDKRVVKDLGGNQVTTGYELPGGADRNHESVSERIQAWEIRGQSGLIEYQSQKNNFLKSLDRGKEKPPVKAIVKDMDKGIER